MPVVVFMACPTQIYMSIFDLQAELQPCRCGALHPAVPQPRAEVSKGGRVAGTVGQGVFGWAHV